MSGRKIAYLFQERRHILNGTGTTLKRVMETLFSYSGGNFLDVILPFVIFCIIFLGNFMSIA